MAARTCLDTSSALEPGSWYTAILADGEPLADHLDKIEGHCQPLNCRPGLGGSLSLPERAKVTSAGRDELNSKFKEVLLAALLFQCGDWQGEGRAVLEAYTQDVNGHFATYADHVLQMSSP